MDCLFQKTQSIKNLSNYKISTATSFSLHDVIIFGCKGGRIVIFSVQSRNSIKSFKSYLPCIHNLYYESIGNNLISVESNETNDTFCIVCYHVSTSWLKGSNAKFNNNNNNNNDDDNNNNTNNSDTPTYTYLPLPLQNVTFETKLCTFSGRIALLNQDSGTVNIWQCPAGDRIDFEHYVEIGFKIYPSRYQPSFFIYDNILGYVYEDKLTVLKLNLVNTSTSKSVIPETSRTFGKKYKANDKISIDMSGKDTIFQHNNNVNENANEFLGSLWLRANSSSWKWLDNSCAMASCIVIGSEDSMLKNGGGGKYNVKRLRAGSSLQTLMQSFTYNNVRYNNNSRCNVMEKMLGVLVVNNRYGWLYNVQINSDHHDIKFTKNYDAKFWTKYEFTSSVSSICVKMPFLYVNTFAGVEIWTVPVMKNGNNNDNNNNGIGSDSRLMPCLLTIIQPSNNYSTVTSNNLLLKTKQYLGLFSCNNDSGGVGGGENTNEQIDKDPDNINIDTSKDPELHQYNDEKDNSRGSSMINQVFQFIPIDRICENLIAKAVENVAVQKTFYYVLLNVYNSVNLRSAVLNYKSIETNGSNRNYHIKPADVLLEKLQLCRATSLLSVYLVNYFITSNDNVNGLKCLAQSNLTFKNAISLINKANMSIMPIYLIWLWNLDRLEQIQEFYTMLQSGEMDLMNIMSVDTKSNNNHVYVKQFYACLIMSSESRGDIEYSNMKKSLLVANKSFSKLKGKDENMAILSAIFALTHIDDNYNGNLDKLINVENINKLFESFCTNFPGWSKVSFLLYLAKRKNDWKLTTFGRAIYLKYPNLGVSLLKDIINELSQDQLDGFLRSFSILKIDKIETVVQIYEICTIAYPSQIRFRNKLANLYVQILESQSVDKSFAVNNEMSYITHYDMDKWQDDLVTSIFSNTLSFQRFFISFLLQNIDQIAIGQIFEKIKCIDTIDGYTIRLLLSFEISNPHELLLSLSKLQEYFNNNDLEYGYQQIIKGLLNALIANNNYKVIDKIFCKILKLENDHGDQQIFRSLIHTYAQNWESRNFKTLIFDEMVHLKPSISKLQRLCRAHSAAEILKSI